MSKQLTHLDEHGRARMVNVGYKKDTQRIAVARGAVHMQPKTLQLILEGNMKKGDVLGVAELAGVMAAKRTSDLIPLCHPLMLSHISVTCTPNPKQSCVEIEATVRLTGKTGVEMEALTAVTLAGLTIYDMAKAVDKGMRLTDIHLVRKEGGKSGDWSLVLSEAEGLEIRDDNLLISNL
ncbi:MAG: cyclic pyranopterin monophosphate synthase MoaC [Chloroflexi bacterium]|nr:cyclic pyranopterin monophosphate synthase MoaC [Chloroflexota bacterium]